MSDINDHICLHHNDAAREMLVRVCPICTITHLNIEVRRLQAEARALAAQIRKDHAFVSKEMHELLLRHALREMGTSQGITGRLYFGEQERKGQ